jgi:hypothetical protein
MYFFACSGLLVIMIESDGSVPQKLQKQHIQIIYITTVLAFGLQEFMFIRFEVII